MTQRLFVLPFAGAVSPAIGAWLEPQMVWKWASMGILSRGKSYPVDYARCSPRAQGIDLYASGPSEEKTIHRAVAFMVAAMDDEEVVHPYAKANIHGTGKDWRRQDFGNVRTTMGWAIPYTARFPNHPNTIRIQALRSDVDSDHGALFNQVLREGAAVEGHWSGVRSDCFYRMS